MKLMLYELKKVLSKKVFLIILSICFVLNIGIFCFVQQGSAHNTFIRSEYPSMVEEYTTLSLNETEEKLAGEMKAYEILTEMNMVSSAESQEEIDALLSELALVQKESPDAYARAEEMQAEGGDTWTRHSYIFTLQQQVEYIKSYPYFIGEMRARADEQAGISIFSNQNDFSYKNLYQTAEDYAHLSDRKLSIGNDLPITTVGEYHITDYFLIAMVFLACVYLFAQEREKGLYNLVRSTQNGRGKTIIAKFIVLMIVTAAVSVLFSLSINAVGIFLYGSVDFSRAIQSIAAYRNCIFALNIGEFILLTVCGKALGMMVIASLFAMLFVVFSNSSLMYMVSAAILIAEYLLQDLINSGTAFNYPKYLNLFYLLDSADFWGNYVNLNFFTNPISVYRVDIFIFTIAFIACFAITVVLFIQKEQQDRIGLFSAWIEKFSAKHRKISGSTSVLFGELYKYLVLNKMVMVLIILLCFGVVSSIGTVSYPYADISDSEYKTYMATLQGELTVEKENHIAEEQAFFDSLHQRIEEYADDDSLSESAINTINGILDTKGKAFERVAEQYERLLALRNEGKEVGFIDENLYSTFVASPTREWRNLITLFFVLLFSIPFIFTVEYQRDMITLLRSTKYGKRNLYAKKIALAFATLVIAFIAVYLPYYIRFANTYGTQNFNTPITCIGMYQHISDSLSVIGSAILNAACYFAIAMAGVSVIILICTTVKSHLLSVIISTVILVLPCLVLYPYKNVRVGMIFSGSYVTASVFIIMLSIIMTAICLTTASVQFTNKRIGGKKHVRA